MNEHGARHFRTALLVRHVVIVLALLALLLVLLSPRGGIGGEIIISSDQDASTVPSDEPDGAPIPPCTAPAALDNPAAPQRPPTGGEDQVDPLVTQRAELIRLYEPQRQEEEEILRSRVQILDRESAVSWSAGFLSAKPLNCPVRDQGAWIEAILWAIERNNLPICKELLGLVTSIVSIESGFHVDPPCLDRSRGESMVSMLDRAERQFLDQMGSIMLVPPVPQLYATYRERYRPKLLTCMTEGQVEIVARQISEDLKKDASMLPDMVKKVLDSELDRLKHVVRTKGSMQLNFARASRVMRDRGEQLSDEQLTKYMYSMRGGVDVGVASLKPMFVQYGAHLAQPDNLSWLFLVGMDYHYGPFSSRNMMEQIRIRDLSHRQIALDGDLLRYDAMARPVGVDSETLRTAASIFPHVPKSEIFKAFLLEKEPHYVYTEIYQAIAKAHRERFGETPFAVVGDLWVDRNAQIKHGLTWRTKSYLKKLDRYLNSIPWDQ